MVDLEKNWRPPSALGPVLSLLGWAGYTPNADQPYQVQFHVAGSVCAGTIGMQTCWDLIVALAYPIDEGIHADIRAAITQRRTGQTVQNPLSPSSLAGG